MKTISVLLTVFNRREKTLSCLRNLYKQDLPEEFGLDVYLTDDGCTDGTPEAVVREFPGVNIVRGDGSLFWNHGMIAAWQKAAESNPDFYLWLNDDTDLLPGAIKILIAKFHESCREAIVVGTCCASDDCKKATYGARTVAGKLINTNEIHTEHPATFNGNILLVPRSAFKILGTLSPEFRHSLGDWDYGFRATEAGIPIAVAEGFLGVCDLHPNMAKWEDPSLPLALRWKHFLSPTGANPFELFRFKRRHKGTAAACITFCSNFIHVLFPALWVKK